MFLRTSALAPKAVAICALAMTWLLLGAGLTPAAADWQADWAAALEGAKKEGKLPPNALDIRDLSFVFTMILRGSPPES